MLKTNIDLVLDLLRKNRNMSVSDIARQLGTTAESIQKSAEYLEEEGLLRIEYRFMRPYLVLTEKRQEEKSARENKDPLDFNSSIMETEIKVPEPPKEERQYAALEQSEVELAQFPKEVHQPEKQESPQLFQPQKPVFQKKVTEPQIQEEPNLNEDVHFEPFHPEEVIREQPEEQPEDQEVAEFHEPPQEETKEYSNIVFVEPLETVYGSDYDEIEAMIQEIGKQIESGDQKAMNNTYKLIYEKLQYSTELTDEQRNVLKNKVAGVFSKIKKIYLR